MMPAVGTHMIQELVCSMEYYKRRYKLNNDHFPYTYLFFPQYNLSREYC